MSSISITAFTLILLSYIKSGNAKWRAIIKNVKLLEILALRFECHNLSYLFSIATGSCIKCFQCSSTEDQRKPTGVWSLDQYTQNRYAWNKENQSAVTYYTISLHIDMYYR